jgi:hypothetical protein
MNDIIDPATGLPLTFRNPAEEAYARAREFTRLLPEERWNQIPELMEMGMDMVHRSPRRPEIDRRLEAQEAEWQNVRGKFSTGMLRDPKTREDMHQALKDVQVAHTDQSSTCRPGTRPKSRWLRVTTTAPCSRAMVAMRRSMRRTLSRRTLSCATRAIADSV